MSGWNYRQDTDITSGHMDRMPASPCVANTTALVDTDFNGGDLHCQRDLGLSNGCVAGTDASRSGVLNYRTFGPPELRFAQCSELCCREPKCKYFSVTDAGACYLKKSMGAAPPGSDDDNGADGSGGDGKKNPGPSGAVAASVAAGRGGGGGGQPNVFSAIGNWLRSGLQRPRRHHRRRRSWWGRFADSQAGNGAEAEDADAAADADAGVAGAAGAASGPASVQIPMELDAKALAITGGVKPLPAAAAAVQQAAAAPAIAAGAGATGAGQEAEGAAALAAVLAHSGAAGHRFIAADTKAAAHAQAGAQVAVQLDVDAGTGQGNAPRRVVHRGGWMSGIKGGLPKTDCAVAPPEKVRSACCFPLCPAQLLSTAGLLRLSVCFGRSDLLVAQLWACVVCVCVVHEQRPLAATLHLIPSANPSRMPPIPCGLPARPLCPSVAAAGHRLHGWPPQMRCRRRQAPAQVPARLLPPPG